MGATRWGILGTGWISSAFTKDLLISPTTRGVSGIQHSVVAVASRSSAKAREFVDGIWKDTPDDHKRVIAAYGTYEELYADPNVDVIYIGTPHSHHFQHAYQALSAGKNVLCEKSLVVTGDQAQTLVDLAQKNDVFLMEAIWTRFQPSYLAIRDVVRSGVLGDVRSVQSELGFDFQEEILPPNHRMLAPNLAGGALLDLGPYPWTWLALALLPPSEVSDVPLKIPNLVAAMANTKTGVDAHTVAIIQFPQAGGRIVQGTLTASLLHQTNPARSVIVNGSKGFLEIHWPPYNPTSFSYSAWKNAADFQSIAGDASSRKAPSLSRTFTYNSQPGL